MKVLKIIFISLFLFCTGSHSVAATWYSVASGNAETGAVWSLITTGPGSTATALGGFNSTVDIVIQNGNTIDLFSVGNIDVRDLTVNAGGVLYSTNSVNRYINVYGNITCNGVIGNGTVFNSIAFNIEGANCLISGTGQFDASRFRKSYTNNLVTNLIIAMNLNLRFDSSSGTQIYNNVAGTYSKFNVTINAGVVVNLTGSTASKGNAAIDGIDGTGNGERTGNYTINGTLIISGILYAFTNNTLAADSCNWVIGPAGLVVASQVISPASGAGKHNFTIQPGGKLEINGTNAFSPFTTTNNVYRCQSGSIVEYSYAGYQTVEAAITYGNLNISNSGSKVTNGSLTVNNDLTISGSAVLSANTNFIYLKGNWNNWNQSGFTESTGSVRFNGTSNSQTINCPGGEVFYNLQIQNAFSTGVVLNTNVDVINDLNLFTVGVLTFGNTARTLTLLKDNNTSSFLGNSNARVDMNGAAHIFNIAAWACAYNGYLIGGQGTVIYNGNNNLSGFNQKILNGVNISYNNLLLQGTGIKYTDNNITAAGNFTVDGPTVSYAALVSTGRTFTLGGNLTLMNGGSMDIACKSNISFITSGNGNQVFDGGSGVLRMYDLVSSKTSGSLSLLGPASRSTTDLNNDLLIDFSGSSLLQDNSNLIYIGDDAQIGGSGATIANFNFTGTLNFNGSNANGDLHISDFAGINMTVAKLNNVQVNTGLNISPLNNLDIYPASGLQLLYIKGNLDILSNSIVKANSNNIAIAGNWNTWDAAGFDELATTVTFNGTTNQQINSFTNELFNNLTISKTSGSVILNTPVTVNNILNLTNGLVNSSTTNLITIVAGASAINASNSSFVNGPVMKSGNTTFVFPTGKGSYYRPISINNPILTGSFIAEYFQNDPQSIPYSVVAKDPTLDHISRCEYWSLERSSGTATPQVTLSWNSNTSCGVTNLSELRVASWNGSLWKDEGNGGTTGSTFGGTIISASAINQFQVFTLSSSTNNNPLPVELISFTGKNTGNVNELKWATSSEINNDYFIVERSQDGVKFNAIGSVDGNGTTNETHEYYFSDFSFNGDINYYRLKQIDYNGKFACSKTISIRKKNSTYSITLYPNPVSDQLFVNAGDLEVLSFVIYSADGKSVKELIPGSTISSLFQINLSGLNQGIYFIKVSFSDGSTESSRIVKN